MRVPFNWLAEYVDLTGLTPQEVAEKLTMGAFEVEEIRLFGPDIQGQVVVGEIVEINPHPNANKIRLTKVKVDSKSEPLGIVCGALNIEVGHIVPVALPGAKVINRHDGTPLNIQVSTIRGAQSIGMLCSPPELGLTVGESEGILIFDKAHGYKLGQDVKEILGLTQDHVLHVSPRSNRGDALSIRGLAREVAALTGRAVKTPDWSLPQHDQGITEYTCEIENVADCELFTIRSIADIKIAPPPQYIVRRLESVGVRSISNVVDITNYVMYELGQSLHAYDSTKVANNHFAVRRARKGESIKTIDGKSRGLTEEILVIADGKTLVGVAGIMGGLDSEIGDTTTALALEAACFTAARVRRGTRLLGMSSEASLRFERGVDVGSVVTASDRATYLIAKHCGGDKPVRVGKMSKAGSADRKPVIVPVRMQQVKRLLEIDVQSHKVAEMLKPLGFKTSESKGAQADTVEFIVPTFRQQDITREIDLIEEVCRIYGYDRMPESMPKNTVAAKADDDTTTLVRRALAGQGLSEAWISSLVPPEKGVPGADESDATAFDFRTQNPDTLVRVENPLSKDHQVMRQSLLPGLVQAAKYNRDHGRKNVWLFEVGRTYLRQSGRQPNSRDTTVDEPLKIAGILTGNPTVSEWVEHATTQDHNGAGSKDSASSKTSLQATTIDFYQTKGIIENMLRRLRVNLGLATFSAGNGAPQVMHPAKSAKVLLQDKTLGWLGEIHPNCADKFGLIPETYLFELDMAVLEQFRQPPMFAPIVTSPAAVRDLTVDVPQSVDHASALACIKGAAGPNFQAAELVSKFALARDLQSLSYRLTFQHPEQTLRSEEVDAYLEKIRAALTKQLGGSFRS
jgi:phenylalanyl-tRNA synthetase beta chain